MRRVRNERNNTIIMSLVNTYNYVFSFIVLIAHVYCGVSVDLYIKYLIDDFLHNVIVFDGYYEVYKKKKTNEMFNTNQYGAVQLRALNDTAHCVVRNLKQ